MTPQRRTATTWLRIGALLVALAGCGFPAESEANVLSDDAVPEALRPSSTISPATGTGTVHVDVWLVSDAGLVSVGHRVPAPVTASAAVETLLLGPTEAEQDRALRSAIPDPSVVVSVAVAGGSATVDLAPAFAQIPASDQVLALGQLVLTLTDLRGLGRVQFTIEGSPVPVPLPTGTSTDDSVSRDDFAELTAP